MIDFNQKLRRVIILLTAKPEQEYYDTAKTFLGEVVDAKKLQYADVSGNENEFLEILAYFLSYGYLPLYTSLSSSDTEKINIAINTLSSAPWLGATGYKYKEPFEKLVRINILKFMNLYESSDYAMVFCIDEIAANIKEDSKIAINTYLEKAKKRYEKRLNLHSDLGWTSGVAHIKREINETINQHQTKKLTIKLVAYHGRTWFSLDVASGFFQDLLSRYKNIKLKLLLVDAKANIVVREGSTQEQHELSSNNGLQVVSKLPRQIKKRIDSRFYGRKIEDSFMRGMLIEDQQGNILNVNITNWRFGVDRGIYGRELMLGNDSSLAKICSNYFDQTFKNARPTGNLFNKLLFIIKQKWYYITISLIPISVIIISYIRKAIDPNIEVYGTFENIILSVWGLLSPFIIEKWRK